ncbi:hypothetical protein [Haloplasma contractile]|uniref:Uncharacterized protein n=1 Tax=Haloplasma contractile SSD-17B TaxID=1033810 RepID=F7PVF7_9MOLU|nr:hypothetical protein [Haloplasma contractile]ERJ12877.1 hypothetical protein HLPCO_001217 [Haloplasma contractile SSD-17B]
MNIRNIIVIIIASLLAFGFMETHVEASEDGGTANADCKLVNTIEQELGNTFDAAITYKGDTYGIRQGIETIGACDSDFSLISKFIDEDYFHYLFELGGDNPEQFMMSLIPNEAQIREFTGTIKELVNEIDLPDALVDAGFLDDIDINGTVEFNIPENLDVNLDTNIPDRIEIVTPKNFTIDSNIPDKITVEAELSNTTTGVITVSIVGLFIISSIALIIAIKKESY